MTNLSRNRLTDMENRLVVARGGGIGEGTDWEFGVTYVNYYKENGQTTRSYYKKHKKLYSISYDRP